MQKIKFDFEATKERIYAPNSNVPIGAPVDRNGNIANDSNAYGIVLCKETENEKYWVKYNLVVMVAGYCDIIDAQAIWGDEYSAEAIAAMSDINFCYDHKIGGGGGWPADLPIPSAGGYGWTDSGEQQILVAPVTAETSERSWNNHVVGDFLMTDNANFYEIMNIVNQSQPDYPVSVKVNDEVYKVIGAYDDDEDEFVVLQFGIPNDSFGVQYGTLTRYDGQNSFKFDMDGEYVDAGITTVSVFIESETVHTIDPKYIGGMVVHFAFDPSAETGVTADKTVAETKQMLNNGTVGFVFIDEDSNTIYGNIGTMLVNSVPTICAYCPVTSESINEANVNAIILSFDGDTWELA